MSSKEVNEKKAQETQEKTTKKEHEHEHVVRVKNVSKWTYERCLKYAKRYQSEEEWSKGAPSSYKAAKSHGWVEKCCTHFEKNYSTGYNKVA